VAFPYTSPTLAPTLAALSVTCNSRKRKLQSHASASKHSKRHQRAYQSWKRKNENYENAA